MKCLLWNIILTRIWLAKAAACVLQQKKNECEIFLLEVGSCFFKMHTNVCTNNKGFSFSLNSGNAHEITHKCV